MKDRKPSKKRRSVLRPGTVVEWDNENYTLALRGRVVAVAYEVKPDHRTFTSLMYARNLRVVKKQRVKTGRTP